MKISKNFSLSELIVSPTATKYQIDNTPADQQILLNLCGVTHNILQPVRDKFGLVTVNSGYRGPELNKKIGGSRNSQHMFGEASDFEVYGVPNIEVAAWIYNNLVYDKLILEFYDREDGGNSGWIHCSFRVTDLNRKESYEYGKQTEGKYIPWVPS